MLLLIEVTLETPSSQFPPAHFHNSDSILTLACDEGAH